MTREACSNGHAKTDENTYRKSNGTKGCATCRADASRRWRLAHPDHRARKNLLRRAKAAPRIASVRIGVCECCGAEFSRSNRGHRRKYCGETCKSLHFNQGDSRRWRWLWDRYRVTKAQFEAMLTEQGNACAICRVVLSGVGLDKTAPQLDHCHSAGSPRGILCRLCNTALGNFKDDPALIQSALEYLATRVRAGAAA